MTREGLHRLPPPSSLPQQLLQFYLILPSISSSSTTPAPEIQVPNQETKAADSVRQMNTLLMSFVTPKVIYLGNSLVFISCNFLRHQIHAQLPRVAGPIMGFVLKWPRPGRESLMTRFPSQDPEDYHSFLSSQDDVV